MITFNKVYKKNIFIIYDLLSLTGYNYIIIF